MSSWAKLPMNCSCRAISSCWAVMVSDSFSAMRSNSTPSRPTSSRVRSSARASSSPAERRWAAAVSLPSGPVNSRASPQAAAPPRISSSRNTF